MDRLTRRQVLGALGIGAVAATSGISLGQQDSHPKAEKKGDSWDELRALFDLDPAWVHMAGLLLASHPKPVKEAIERHRKGLDDNPVNYLHAHDFRAEFDARKAAAEYLNGSPNDIALTDSTTMGLALLYNGISVDPNQEIVHTRHDHQSTIQSIGLRAQKSGTKVRSITLYQDPAKTTKAEVLDNLRRGLQSNTRVLAVTWVHSATGVRLPIPEMGAVIRELNAGRDEKDQVLFCVDAVHGFGNQVLDVTQFGCDFFSAGTHKWLFGPRGTGILWGRREVQKFVTPTIPAFGPGFNWGDRMTPGGFHSFEHRWALKEAFQLHRQLGQESVQLRIAELNRQTKEGLAKMPKVKLYTPVDEALSAGIVCFDVEGLRPYQVVQKLAEKKIIASTTPYQVSYARVTPSLLNTPEDVEKTLVAIRDLTP